MGLHCKHLLEEMGFKVRMTLEGDASAALEASAKLSIGRMRHLRVADSFVRLILKTRLARSRKIGTKENAADLLTKYVDKKTLEALLPQTGWRKITDEFSLTSLTQVNQLKDLKDSSEIERAHKAKEIRRISELGQSLMRASTVACIVQGAAAAETCVAGAGEGGYTIAVVALIGSALIFGAGAVCGYKLCEWWRVPGKGCKDVACPSQCTYTRWREQPRFQVLADGAHG